jgi:hypothetical protein
MAYRSMTFATVATIIASYVSPVMAVVFTSLHSFFRAVMLMPVHFDWRSVRNLSAVAYRKITDLKPVYRDSYDTHGLSLAGGRP